MLTLSSPKLDLRPSDLIFSFLYSSLLRHSHPQSLSMPLFFVFHLYFPPLFCTGLAHLVHSLFWWISTFPLSSTTSRELHKQATNRQVYIRQQSTEVVTLKANHKQATNNKQNRHQASKYRGDNGNSDNQSFRGDGRGNRALPSDPPN